MKKVLFTALLLASASVSATDLGLSVGRDQAVRKDVTALSVGTSVVGLKATASLSTVRDTYSAVSGSVGKSFGVVKSVSVTPSIGLQRINPDRGIIGYAAVAGVEGAYALSKDTALVASFSHRYDVKDAAAFKGNQVTAGLKVSF